MSKTYSKNELQTLQTFINNIGHLTYQRLSTLESEYAKKTGVHRASGALYMAAWRLERGYYDNILSS
ncbi:hypothetical protein [Treponema lecithinolyticum]|uniref:hypothetical protein n=1 Tax=Treponema lecithinolyticum TaxID=53418 RepID=UPI003608F22F